MNSFPDPCPRFNGAPGFFLFVDLLILAIIVSQIPKVDLEEMTARMTCFVMVVFLQLFVGCFNHDENG